MRPSLGKRASSPTPPCASQRASRRLARRHMKASAGSPQRKKNGKPLLVAPPVFVRILPANVGGHFDDGTAHVAKRLKSWVGTCGGGDVDDGGNASTNAPCVILSDSHGDTKYSFPKDVFGPSIRQAAIFNDVASPLLLKFLDEHDPQSVILFAYGQTGTGKTHTLMGPEASWDTVHHPDWGMFPRVVADVLRVMDSRQGNYSYAAHLSATEFYFCQGFDLLDAKAQVLVTDGTIVGAKQIRVTNASDVLHVLAEVRATRTTAHTKMNPASTASVAGSSSNKTNNTNAAHGGSSRSHCALSLRLRVVDKRTLFVKTVTFTCMDLAGAERQASNGNDHVSAMEAVMQFWRNPSNVAPCAQATIINYELACLRSAIVQAAENHRVGRKVTAPTQLGTAAVNYMHGLFDGRCHVANVVTLSQSKKCGWETWFACTYAEDVSLLRMPAGARSAMAVSLKKLTVELKRKAEASQSVYEKTPEKNHPSSKYFARRKIEARHFANEAKIVEELARGLETTGET